MRLASATATGVFGLRSSIRASHAPSGALLRAAHRTNATAPMISNLRMSRRPIFDVRPSRSLPALDCCPGARPTQAAKPRLFEKVSIGGAKVVTAAAAIGLAPGSVVSRRAVSSLPARRRSSTFRPAIFPLKSAAWSKRRRARSCAAAGNAPSKTAARRRAWAGPTGATLPCAARWVRCALIVCVRWRRTRRSRVPQTAWSDVMPPPQSPPHRPCHSSGASQKASPMQAGSVGSRDRDRRSRGPGDERSRRPPSPLREAAARPRTSANVRVNACDGTRPRHCPGAVRLEHVLVQIPAG